MPSRPLPMVAVTSTTVSPYRTVQEPLACFASLPVSTDSVLPPHSSENCFVMRVVPRETGSARSSFPEISGSGDCELADGPRSGRLGYESAVVAAGLALPCSGGASPAVQRAGARRALLLLLFVFREHRADVRIDVVGGRRGLRRAGLSFAGGGRASGEARGDEVAALVLREVDEVVDFLDELRGG